MSVCPRLERGFSLIEVSIALLITMVVMTSVFLLLQKGQESFRREPEISDMNANARTGLDQLSQDLAVAGLSTPPNLAVMWSDGGGITPDGVTVLYADSEIPVARPWPCAAGGPCDTVGASSVLSLDPESLSPRPPDFEQVYLEGMVLFALQGPNGNPVCDAVSPGLVSFLVTEPPKCMGTGGSQSGPTACGSLELKVDPGRGVAGIGVPRGFERDVSLDCAVVGLFHVVQYRVNPLPPAPSPSLERRDAALGEPWTQVASNIEDLQIQYAQGIGDHFADEPAVLPVGNDPGSFITRVHISVGGRSASTNLQGATSGVFAADETHLRRSFTTTVSLRNQLTQAQQKAFDLGLPGYN